MRLPGPSLPAQPRPLRLTALEIPRLDRHLDQGLPAPPFSPPDPAALGIQGEARCPAAVAATRMRRHVLYVVVQEDGSSLEADAASYDRPMSDHDPSDSAITIVGIRTPVRSDSELARYYERLRHRKGPNAAKAATARRLSTIVYRVLSQGRPYEGRPRPEPTRRNAARTAIAELPVLPAQPKQLRRLLGGRRLKEIDYEDD